MIHKRCTFGIINKHPDAIGSFSYVSEIANLEMDLMLFLHKPKVISLRINSGLEDKLLSPLGVKRPLITR